MLREFIQSIFGHRASRDRARKPRRRVVYRLVYDAGDVVEKPVKVQQKPKKREKPAKKKAGEVKEEPIEDVEKAIEYLILAAKNVVCPFCRAKVVHLIDYFYSYHYKTLLAEAGVDPNKIDEVYEERYAGIVKEKVAEIKRELGVGDLELKQTAKEFVQELLA